LSAISGKRNLRCRCYTVNLNLSAELERIINKALEKDREFRYYSAAELRTDLKRLKRGRSRRGATLLVPEICDNSVQSPSRIVKIPATDSNFGASARGKGPMTTKPASKYSFGIFELDLRSGELRKNGSRLKIQDQSLRVLALLLDHPGELVTRDELRNQLWPADTFVDFDHSINVAIKRLREALSDEAENPRFIETLPKRGYRFIAPVNRPLGDAPTTSTRARSAYPILYMFAFLAVLGGLGVAAWLYFARGFESKLPPVRVVHR
jgi:DNA-binding winged helix-turn-helix (wHTH) protein